MSVPHMNYDLSEGFNIVDGRRFAPLRNTIYSPNNMGHSLYGPSPVPMDYYYRLFVLGIITIVLTYRVPPDEQSDPHVSY